VPDPSSLPDLSVSAPPARVSDADREQVVDRLRDAAGEGRLDLDEFSDRVTEAYRSATPVELERLTAALPLVVEPGPERPPTRWTVGVFSSERRFGPWRPATPTRVWASFGSCRVDLAEIECREPEVQLEATAVFGGVEVLVPTGVTVELDGFALFGSKSYRVTPAPPRPDFPRVRVRARAVFGNVTVRTPRRPVP
jgi:hypothetical protein